MSELAPKRVLPVVDGMAVPLGDFAQNIEVRAKSLGPGFCAVHFVAGQASPFEFQAPPLVWGDWLEIPYGFIGAGSITLGFKILCDTGALGEVRFH